MLLAPFFCYDKLITISLASSERVADVKSCSRSSSDTPVQQDIGRYGFPVTGAEVRYYANHTLSYDQARKTPRWVAEHLSDQKLLGSLLYFSVRPNT